MRTLAILPVKRFDLAKSRLGEELQPDQRRRLAEAMVLDVLAALLATPAVEAVVMITNEEAVARAARDRGATVLPDPHESGQSDAALVGIRHALAGGYQRALLVPGDCPALDERALLALLETPTPAPAVTIVSDRHGSGTNALLLTPPDAIAPSFGPGSFERHRELAERAGAAWRVERLAGLLLDVDTPEDLAQLRSAVPGSRTRAALEEL